MTISLRSSEMYACAAGIELSLDDKGISLIVC